MEESEIKESIDRFVSNCFDSDITIYEALQFEQAIDSFNLQFLMEENDYVTEELIKVYMARLRAEENLTVHEYFGSKVS